MFLHAESSALSVLIGHCEWRFGRCGQCGTKTVRHPAVYHTAGRYEQEVRAGGTSRRLEQAIRASLVARCQCPTAFDERQRSSKFSVERAGHRSGGGGSLPGSGPSILLHKLCDEHIWLLYCFTKSRPPENGHATTACHECVPDLFASNCNLQSKQIS